MARRRDARAYAHGPIGAVAARPDSRCPQESRHVAIAARTGPRDSSPSVHEVFTKKTPSDHDSGRHGSYVPLWEVGPWRLHYLVRNWKFSRTTTTSPARGLTIQRTGIRRC